MNGQEYGMDVINDLNGNFASVSVKVKYAMRSGETDCAITVCNEDIADIGKRLSGFSKHPGNLDVDVFVVDEKPYVLEMNARFGGGYPFSHIAGVNLPKAIVQWLHQKEVDAHMLKARMNVTSQKDIVIVELNR